MVHPRRIFCLSFNPYPLMKPMPAILCLFGLFAGVLSADEPTKRLGSEYRELWLNSPFTTKPPPPTAAPTYNVMQDYVLLGVAPAKDGYIVTMLNRKRPSDPRITVVSNQPSDGFVIKNVIHKKGDPLGTRVLMQRGSSAGEIGFEEKYLVLKSAPKPQQPRSNRPTQSRPGQSTGQPGSRPTPPRAPRRPIISGRSSQSSSQGGRTAPIPRGSSGTQNSSNRRTTR